MSRGTKAVRKPSTVCITIQAADCQDTGLGIVIARHPLTLLVPRHLVELVEQGQSQSIFIDDVPCDGARILPAPALQRDHLSILRFRRTLPRKWTSIRIPRTPFPLSEGQTVQIQRSTSQPSGLGRICDVRDRGDGCSVITDIAVSSGDSGSPLLVDNQLAAVCQGMIQGEGSGTAVAVPLSEESLTELRMLRRRYRISLVSALLAALLLVSATFGGFAVYSANTFSLAAIEIADDGSQVTARNAQAPTLKPSWSRSFDTPIRRSIVFPTRVGGDSNRIAVGTAYRDGMDGAIHLLNSNGKILWSYSVPDGECVYSSAAWVYDGFLVDVIHVADLDEDGVNEILVSFVHNHDEPCKLVTFDLQGRILSEYWHPGYIRTIATGRAGPEDEVLIVASASNNAIATDWWNPQTIFAFRGLPISGCAPPIDYLGAAERTETMPGTEIWYQVIVNIDPEFKRAKCYELDIQDFNGDGEREIQAALTDGRFYYIDASGSQLNVTQGDSYKRDFPGIDPPPLVDYWEYLRQTKAT